MTSYTDFEGAIFDVDDTLLDNKPRDPAQRLHSRSRLAAVRAIGKRHGIEALTGITPQQNLDGWTNAREHSIEGAAWAILFMAGLVPGEAVDHDHQLVREIAALKHELHEEILRTEGREVPGASAFVRTLAANGFGDKLAIASTAPRNEIDIFLGITGLASFFGDRIIAAEDVTRLKPDPEAFIEAYRTLQLPDGSRKNVLAFEDHPRGITAARAAGLYVCAITTGFDREELAGLAEPPDLVADSYAEFTAKLGLPATLET